jgi:hypothetical protein
MSGKVDKLMRRVLHVDANSPREEQMFACAFATRKAKEFVAEWGVAWHTLRPEFARKHSAALIRLDALDVKCI